MAIQSMNLALRFILELCVIVAVCYWGFVMGKGFLSQLLLGVGVPLVITFVWGTFGAPKAAKLLTGWPHLLLEVVIFGSGVLSLYLTGYHLLAILFGVVLILNRILIYVWVR